jgi:hypothetical protein
MPASSQFNIHKLESTWGVKIKGLVHNVVYANTDPYYIDQNDTIIFAGVSGVKMDLYLDNAEFTNGKIIHIIDYYAQADVNYIDILSNANSFAGKHRIDTNGGSLTLIWDQTTNTWHNISPPNESRAGYLVPGDFSAGSPRTASVSFTTTALGEYAVAVTGEDARMWTIESKTSTGFTINSNSSVALNGNTYWSTTPVAK